MNEIITNEIITRVTKTGRKPKVVLVDAYPANFPSLGLGYIAAYIREKNGITDIKILQKELVNNIPQAILDENPDIVGYFSVTPRFDYVLSIIKEIRQKAPNMIQILGGPHMTALPQVMPKEIDIGVINEGEEASSELMDLFIKHGSLPKEELKKIKGICFYEDNGKLFRTPGRGGLKNLDDIPFPARDLLNVKDFYPVAFRGFPTKSFKSTGLMTSRGCPFTCKFCQEEALSTFRYHSAERAVAEMEELIEKYDVEFIQIMDDVFITNKPRLVKIVDLIIEKGIDKKVGFFCYLRANQINEYTTKLLKKMNTQMVFVGFESGSDKILKYLKDSSCSVEKNQAAFDMLRKYDIDVYGAFIAGSPPETMEDLQKTYDFIKKNHLSNGDIFVLTPLPGTQIWNYAIEKGLIDPTKEIDWNRFLIKNSSDTKDKFWLSEHITQDEYFQFFEAKLRPLFWHYMQVANRFKITDLMRVEFWRLFKKRPKFYLSVLKQSVIHLFACHTKLKTGLRKLTSFLF